MAATRSLAPVFLLGGLGVFIAVIAFAVATAFVRPEPPVFELTPSRDGTPVAQFTVDTLTVDTGDPDAWTFVDLTRGIVVSPPDTSGWDLAFRRFSVITAGAVADLGPRPFDSVRTAPADGYVATTYGRDSVNSAMERWYDYSFVTHVLSPNGHVYAMRTREGHYAKVAILGYYCPGVVPGCLTLRYGYQPDGSRRFDPS